MSYHVLARKWRPKTFSELVGQSHVVKAFSYALDHDKVHHAYLLTGTRGVGKTSIARIFAKSLNCLEKGVSSSPCGQCSNCVDIEKGKFVDLIEVDAASRTGVDETQELIESVVYMPTKGRYKVYLIDEVHMFSKSSFNALLKTLEEPPSHVKFILATTDVEKLPVTILSRCLQFNLKRLTDAQISSHLKHICESEAIPYDKSAIETLARAGDGSLRDALSVTDQAIAYGQGELRVDDVVSILGTVHPSDVIGIVKAVLSNDPSALYGQIRRLDDYDLDVKSLFVAINQKFQLLAWAKEGVNVEVPELLMNLAKPVSKPLLQLWYDLVNKGLEELNSSQDKDNTLEMTLLRLLAFIPNDMISRHHTVTDVAADEGDDEDEMGEAVYDEIDTAEADSSPMLVSEVSDSDNTESEQQTQAVKPKTTIDSETEREFYEEMLSLAGAGEIDAEEVEEEQAVAAVNTVKENISQGEESNDNTGTLPWEEASEEVSATKIDKREDATEHEVVTRAQPEQEIKSTEIENTVAAQPVAKEPVIVEAVAAVKQPVDNVDDSEADLLTEATRSLNDSVDGDNIGSNAEDSVNKAEFDWHRLFNRLELSDFTREFAASGLLEINDNQATLSISPRHAVLNTADSQAELSEALAKELGQPVYLNVDYAEVINTPAEHLLALQEKQQNEVVTGFYQHPLVTELVETFSAKVIDRTIKVIEE